MAVPAVPGGSQPLGIPSGYTPRNPSGKLPAGMVPLGTPANDNSWGYRELAKGLRRWPRPIPFGTLPLVEPIIDAFNKTSDIAGSYGGESSPLPGWTFTQRTIVCTYGGSRWTYTSNAQTVNGGACGVVLGGYGYGPTDNVTTASTIIGVYGFNFNVFPGYQNVDPIGYWTKGPDGVDADTTDLGPETLNPSPASAPIIATPLPMLVPYVYPSTDPFTAPAPLRWAPSPQRVPFHQVPRLPRTEPNGDPARGPGPDPAKPSRRVRFRPQPGTEVIRDPDTKSRQNPAPDTVPAQRIVFEPHAPTRLQQGVHAKRTPRKPRKEKEVKFLLRNASYFAAGAVVNVVGEACDAVEAIYAALPFSVRKKYERKLARYGSYENWIEYISGPDPSGTSGLDRIAGSAAYLKEREWGLGCDQQLALAYKHFDQIDWQQAAYNLAYNQVVDWGFGKLGQAAGKLGKQTGMAVGFGTGPAL